MICSVLVKSFMFVNKDVLTVSFIVCFDCQRSGCSRLEDFLTRLVTEPEEPQWDFSENRLAFHTKPADESDAGDSVLLLFFVSPQ